MTVEVLTLVLSALALLGLPMLAFIVRASIKWARTEDNQALIARDLAKLVRDEAEAHAAMLVQMREDRAATNERLTWLERNAWPGVRPGARSGRRGEARGS